MSDSIMVSVICLTYNHKDYIRQCLDGILSQETNFKYEVLVFDDASTDGTSDIVRGYCSRYENIIPLIQSENQYSQGKGFVGMNMCFDQSHGKYIAICDGDDCWTHPKKLQIEVDFLERNPNKRFVFTDFSIVNSEGKVVENNVFDLNPGYLGYSLIQQLKSPGYYAPMTWCFMREDFLRIFVPQASCDFSYAVWLHFLSQDSVGYIGINTANYRFMGGTTSHPNSAHQYYKRLQTLFKERLIYADYYQVKDSFKDWLCAKMYLELLPKAIEYKDDVFCKEVEDYFERNGICYDAIVASMDDIYYKQKNELESIKSSKAYRVGKKIAGFYNGMIRIIGLKR